MTIIRLFCSNIQLSAASERQGQWYK